MKHILIGALLALVILAVGGSAAVQLGLPDFAADQPHSETTYRLIEWARERSVAVRSAEVDVPVDLEDAARVRRGAGNYDAMCAGCHLSPGLENTEMRRGLYPVPPDLSMPAAADRAKHARRFWIVRHGIKGSGMPAWSSGGMEDAAIWDLVAFLHVLPGLSADEYRHAVAASDGHSHGGVAPATAHGHSGEQPPSDNSRMHDHSTHAH